MGPFIDWNRSKKDTNGKGISRSLLSLVNNNNLRFQVNPTNQDLLDPHIKYSWIFTSLSIEFIMRFYIILRHYLEVYPLCIISSKVEFDILYLMNREPSDCSDGKDMSNKGGNLP